MCGYGWYAGCDKPGICVGCSARLASDRELDNPDFIRDLRNYAVRLPISSRHWREALNDMYRDYRGCIVDPQTRSAVYLDMEEFERPNIREWFRDFCSRVPADASPYVTAATRERARILATVLRASDPAGTMLWGMRPANDNDPADEPEQE